MLNPYNPDARVSTAQHIGHQLGQAIGNVFFGGADAARAEGAAAAREQVFQQRLAEAQLGELLAKTELTRANTGEKHVSIQTAQENAAHAQFWEQNKRNAYAAKNIEDFNLASVAQKAGSTYDRYQAIGNTGRGFNKATGQEVVFSPEVADQLQRLNAAQVKNFQANAAQSFSTAGLNNARANQVNQETDFAHKHGYKMGTGASDGLGNLEQQLFKTVVDSPTGGKQVISDPVKFNHYYIDSISKGRDPKDPRSVQLYQIEQLLGQQGGQVHLIPPQR